jgi:hypothetical protein
MTIMNYIPSIGDLLIRPKLLGLVQHVGVVIGRNAVFHNNPQKGEHVSTIEEFAAGQDVTVQPTGIDPDLVSHRTRQALTNPKSYHPLWRNCQHSASALIKGVARSPLAMVVGIAIIIFLLWMLLKKR